MTPFMTNLHKNTLINQPKQILPSTDPIQKILTRILIPTLIVQILKTVIQISQILTKSMIKKLKSLLFIQFCHSLQLLMT